MAHSAGWDAWAGFEAFERDLLLAHLTHPVVPGVELDERRADLLDGVQQRASIGSSRIVTLDLAAGGVEHREEALSDPIPQLFGEDEVPGRDGRGVRNIWHGHVDLSLKGVSSMGQLGERLMSARLR